jgi:hypothetical protein
MNHTKHVGVVTLLFAIILAVVLLLCQRSSMFNPTVSENDVQVNEIVSVSRNPLPLCDELRDPGRGFANLHLYVNGLDTGVRGAGCNDGLRPTVSFPLRRIKQADVNVQTEAAAWELVIGNPLRTINKERSLTPDIQWIKDEKITHLTPSGATIVVRIFQWWAPAVLLVVLYVCWLLVYLARRTDLVRDAAPSGTPLQRRTYSLGRTQMAWWFAIVFASFVFLWLVTGEVPAISGQALALLGMSSATTMASTAVTPGRLSDDGVEGVFFLDLLSDAQGVAIHRFQMVVMTIAIGLIFLYDVATRLAMPEFDPSILTLIGISSATYVGLKIPEAAPGPAPAGDPKAGYTPSP